MCHERAYGDVITAIAVSSCYLAVLAAGEGASPCYVLITLAFFDQTCSTGCCHAYAMSCTITQTMLSLKHFRACLACWMHTE